MLNFCTIEFVLGGLIFRRTFFSSRLVILPAYFVSYYTLSTAHPQNNLSAVGILNYSCTFWWTLFPNFVVGGGGGLPKSWFILFFSHGMRAMWAVGEHPNFRIHFSALFAWKKKWHSSPENHINFIRLILETGAKWQPRMQKRKNKKREENERSCRLDSGWKLRAINRSRKPKTILYLLFITSSIPGPHCYIGH